MPRVWRRRFAHGGGARASLLDWLLSARAASRSRRRSGSQRRCVLRCGLTKQLRSDEAASARRRLAYAPRQWRSKRRRWRQLPLEQLLCAAVAHLRVAHALATAPPLDARRLLVHTLTAASTRPPHARRAVVRASTATPDDAAVPSFAVACRRAACALVHIEPSSRDAWRLLAADCESAHARAAAAAPPAPRVRVRVWWPPPQTPLAMTPTTAWSLTRTTVLMPTSIMAVICG
jgi:hypothetical protein